MQFAADAINGLALLELAGVNSGQPPQIYDWGGGAYSVCQVDHEPSQVPDRCFGPTSGKNWSDWYASSSGWAARSSGTSGYLIHDGDVEGWTYTSGFGAPPPSTRFGQVCNVAVPTIAATYAASAPAAVRAAPTATAPPTATSTPTPTRLEAAAPSVSTSGRSALAITGSTSQASKSAAIWPWLLVVGAATLLLSLGVINLRRRGP